MWPNVSFTLQGSRNLQLIVLCIAHRLLQFNAMMMDNRKKSYRYWVNRYISLISYIELIYKW